ncbi:VOC family protein (plasmid) [Hymenobacter tibetensis]|uniref:VOC family protein n=1 Tax=Hymenobacter tibetensis TaxID=497967 RepID=A0ABY4D677_9BACT|nr:VOC family protein [Hymenobacter tibetensis]UOG77529.1 VOC family protein [Hymenobacter tibetensis]
MEAAINPLTLPEKNIHSPFKDMRMGHIGLWTTDFEGLINWYVENLEFRLIRQVDLGHLQLAFLAPATDDNFWLEILCNTSANETPAPAQPATTGYLHFCLDVDNVDQTLAALHQRGIPTVRGPFDVPPIGKRCGFITDPMGNLIEFAQDIA